MTKNGQQTSCGYFADYTNTYNEVNCNNYFISVKF